MFDECFHRIEVLTTQVTRTPERSIEIFRFISFPVKTHTYYLSDIKF